MGKRGPAAKFVVRLTPEERTKLESMIHTGTGAAYRLLKARDIAEGGCVAAGPWMV